MADEKTLKWAWSLAAAISIVIAIVVTVLLTPPSGKKENEVSDNHAPARAAETVIPYVSLHSFPDGTKQIIIPIGPERWEGITLPLGTTAYRIDPTIWHQLKPWDGKPGPIVKKEEAVHRIIPIQINSDLKAATFWVRGEKEATITIK